MMRTLRDKRTMQIVLWIVVAAFVGTIFIAWGMRYSGLTSKDPNLLAQVGEDRITYDEVYKASQPELDRLYAGGENPSNEEITAVRNEILDRLVDQAILESTAKKLGINVSLEEVAADIQREPAFSDASQKFDRNRYYEFLQSRQTTPQDFEASVRRQMLLQKIQVVLRDSVLYTPGEIEGFAGFLSRDLKADYLALDTAKYKASVPMTENLLKNFYEANKAQYDHPERVRASHILLSVPAGGGLPEEQAVTKRLEGFRSDVLSKKAKFDDLAKRYSVDQGSRDRGGDLGYFPRGAIVKEFEDVAFTLKKGEISKPFKTQFGYHIVLVADHEKAYKSTFAEMKDKVSKQYQQKMAFEKVSALFRQISFKLKKSGSMAQVAKELNLPLRTTAYFNRATGIPGVKDSKDISDKLAEVHLQEWRGPFPIGETNYFFQVVDAKPGKVSPEAGAKGIPNLTRRLAFLKEQTWVKGYLEARKKELKVKTFREKL